MVWVFVSLFLHAVPWHLVHGVNCFYTEVAWRGPNTPAKYWCSTRDRSWTWGNFYVVFVLTFFVLVFAYNIVKGISKTWQAGITCDPGLVWCFCLSGLFRLGLKSVSVCTSQSVLVLDTMSSRDSKKQACWFRCHNPLSFARVSVLVKEILTASRLQTEAAERMSSVARLGAGILSMTGTPFHSITTNWINKLMSSCFCILQSCFLTPWPKDAQTCFFSQVIGNRRMLLHGVTSLNLVPLCRGGYQPLPFVMLRVKGLGTGAQRAPLHTCG